MIDQQLLYSNTGIVFKYLYDDDHSIGLDKVLNQLTLTLPFQKNSFINHLNHMKNSRYEYINIVGYQSQRPIAFGTVLLCDTLKGKVGKIQNIVVCSSVRGKGLGRVVIEILRKQAQKRGIFNFSLACETKNDFTKLVMYWLSMPEIDTNILITQDFLYPYQFLFYLIIDIQQRCLND